MSKISFKHRRIMARERQRLRFVFRRDGYEAMKAFARRGVEQYNNSLSSGYGKMYSDELRASILTYLIVLNNK